MQRLIQPSCWWVNGHTLPYLVSAMICFGAHQARKGGPPTNRHNGTDQHFIASVAVTGAAMDFLSFMQLMVAAYSEGTSFGKRTRAAGQKNPVRDTDVSTCQCTNAWNHPDLTLYTQQRGAGPGPWYTLLCLCGDRRSKSRFCFLSCPHVSPLLPEQAHPDLTTACFPSFLQLKVNGHMEGAYKDVSDAKQLICIGRSNLTATPE